MQVIFQSIGDHPDQLKYQILNVKNLSKILSDAESSLNLLLKFAFNYTSNQRHLKFIGAAKWVENQDAIEQMLKAGKIRLRLAQCAIRACFRTYKDTREVFDMDIPSYALGVFMAIKYGCNNRDKIEWKSRTLSDKIEAAFYHKEVYNLKNIYDRWYLFNTDFRYLLNQSPLSNHGKLNQDFSDILKIAIKYKEPLDFVNKFICFGVLYIVDSIVNSAMIYIASYLLYLTCLLEMEQSSSDTNHANNKNNGAIEFILPNKNNKNIHCSIVFVVLKSGVCLSLISIGGSEQKLRILVVTNDYNGTNGDDNDKSKSAITEPSMCDSITVFEISKRISIDDPRVEKTKQEAVVGDNKGDDESKSAIASKETNNSNLSAIRHKESYFMNEDLAVRDALWSLAKEYETISGDANNGWKCYNCHKMNSVVNDCCKHCDWGLNKFYYFIFNERDPKEYHDFICNKKFGLVKGWNKHV